MLCQSSILGWLGDYGVEGTTVPVRAKAGSLRVYRCGVLRLDAAYCRAATRDWTEATHESLDIVER